MTRESSRGIKRDKPNGTNRAEFAVFSKIFADFYRFSLFLGIIAFRKRRFSQKTADLRRKPQIFAKTGLSYLVCPF